jgi:sulfide dehydrogenase cytochrome subunit
MSASPRNAARTALLAATTFLAFGAGSAAAQQAPDRPTERQVRTWAAACAACHNTDGRSIGGFPVLAGRSAEDTYRALVEFRSGQRPATIMHQHTRGYTTDELRHIAEWFANVKPAR